MKKYATKSFDLKVDVKSAVPIYEQIKDAIKISIFNGTLKEGDQLISIRELSNVHHVNPITIMKAYNQLESEGLLHSRRGSGYFVRANPAEVTAGQTELLRREVTGFLKKMAAMGFNARDLLQELQKYLKENHHD
jgi:GntR family transcriptional regulator